MEIPWFEVHLCLNRLSWGAGTSRKISVTH